MAIIIPSGSVVAAINGTLDGYVYYRGRYGNTVRTWVNPVNTITARRTAVRALFASLISLYNSLTPAMQDDWDIAAADQRRKNRLAQQYTPTGLQFFLERNMNLAICGTGPLLLPIPDQENRALLICGIGVITNLTFTTDAFAWNQVSFIPAGYTYVIYTSDNQPAGKMFQYNRWRITFAFSGPINLPVDIITQWLSTWSPSVPITGKRIFMKAQIINSDTGQATAPVFSSKIVS